MKGIILAGGKGTRLAPLTNIVNKHLLPVGRLPMIGHAVAKLREAGILDILIVTSKQSAGLFTEYLGDGHELGVRLAYKIQEQASGIADALLQAEPLVGPGERVTVVLGDNLFEDSLQDIVSDFEQSSGGARVLLKRVEDPRRYGVPVLKDGRIERIVEKPVNPPSSYCVTGIYFYDHQVFKIIRGIRPSARGEMEITDVNNAYAKEGQLTYSELKGWWTDAGTFESLLEANKRFMKEERS